MPAAVAVVAPAPAPAAPAAPDALSLLRRSSRKCWPILNRYTYAVFRLFVCLKKCIFGLCVSFKMHKFKKTNEKSGKVNHRNESSAII
jgi:hypothetical protein